MTNKCVTARFEYVNPRTGETFYSTQQWQCKDQADAELIVKYHGNKYGAHSAECKMEDIDHEEVK